MNIFSAEFWQSNVWQSIGVIVSVITCLISPFLSMLVDRLFNKQDEQQQHINAYKALWLREGSFGGRETLGYLFLQGLAAYALALLCEHVWFINRMDATAWLDFSVVVVFATIWGLSLSKRKILAKVLLWQFCVAMLVFSLLLIGQKIGAPITRDLTFIKHFVGQYLPADIKHFPPIASLQTFLPFKAFPIDFTVSNLAAARSLFIWIYGPSLALFLFGYALHKRHYAQRVTAFAYLSDKERREKLELLTYQERQAALEVKALEKEEKQEDLNYKRQQITTLLEKDQLELEKERLAVEAVRLDLEKKRAEYMLEIAKLMIDTLYPGGGTVEMRAELLRQALPALKDFGHKESTTIVLEHLQNTPEDTPRAIPAVAA